MVLFDLYGRILDHVEYINSPLEKHPRMYDADSFGYDIFCIYIVYDR